SDCIVTSGTCTCQVLIQHYELHKSHLLSSFTLDHELSKQGEKEEKVIPTVVVSGAPGLCDIIRKDTPFKVKTMPKDMKREDIARMDLDPSVFAVVVGYDLDISYNRIAFAGVYARALPSHGLFLATNSDREFPASGQNVLPGAGCLVAPFKEFVVDKSPVYAGKPSKLMLEIAMDKYCVKVDEVVMIGDRLDTDIRMAKDCRVFSICTLTGVTTERVLKEAYGTLDYPDAIIGGVHDLLG
ncbi:hypothetical protein ADUPG1_007238, partial [Aduncisulcus paluster]